jgi:hypothetical protein
MPWTDEMLMAYADGELAPAESAAIAHAAQADPALAARIDGFRQSRARIAALRTDAPAPDALIARVRALDAATARPAETPAEQPTAKVIPLADRRRPAVWQLPLAASVALLAGLAVGAFLPRGDTAPRAAVDILAIPGLADALPTLASGDSATLPDGSRATVIASFDTDTGDFCREIEVDDPAGATLVAVTCDVGDTWQTRLAIAADAGAQGYAPASSLDALDAWLTATGAGAPLSPAEEAARLAAAN